MKRGTHIALAVALSVFSAFPLASETVINTELVKKMIVFIFASRDGVVDAKHPLGTGFLITVPDKGSFSYSGGAAVAVKGVLFLITARHIVDPSWAFCSEPQPETIYLRMNKRDYDSSGNRGGIEYVPVRLLEKGVPKYYVSTDEKVDAAVVKLSGAVDSRFHFSQSEYDYQPFLLSSFANPEEIKNLKIGDSVTSAGLIPGRSGEKRNYPFFKFGEISNIPDEPTWIGCGGPELRLERVWFIATNLVAGNSGSPIFYEPPEMCLVGGMFHCTRGLDRAMIIGVQSSSFDSTDIAGMTPIEDVFKIIEDHAVGADLYRGDNSKRK